MSVKAAFDRLRSRKSSSIQADLPRSWAGQDRKYRFNSATPLKRKWPSVFDETMLVHDDTTTNQKRGEPPAGWVRVFGMTTARAFYILLDMLEDSLINLDCVVILSVIVPFVWAMLVAGAYQYISVVPIKAEAMLLFTGLLGFLLVFRNNQAYSRWYEGRTLMGQLSGEIVLLHQKAGSWIREEGGIENAEEIRECVARYCVALIYCIKYILREEEINVQDLKGIITMSEIRDLQETAIFPPTYIINIIRTAIFHAAISKDQKQTMSNGREGSIDGSLSLISRNIADCIRIRTATFPITYTYILHILTHVYLFALPLVMVDSTGWWIVPSNLCMAILYISLLEMSRALQEPFGYDSTDLSMEIYCSSVEKQLIMQIEQFRSNPWHEYLSRNVIVGDEEEAIMENEDYEDNDGYSDQQGSSAPSSPRADSGSPKRDADTAIASETSLYSKNPHIDNGIEEISSEELRRTSETSPV